MSATIVLLTALLACHYLADYCLTMQVMIRAKADGRQLGPILLHAAVHAVLMGACLLVFGVSGRLLAVLMLIELGTHFIIDTCKARLTAAKPVLANPKHKTYWMLYGFDQLLHQLVVVLIWSMAIAPKAETMTPQQPVDVEAHLRKALDDDQAGRYAEAAQNYRIAAEQGESRAQNNLGVLYKDGQGVAQDYAEAARWFTLAAEQGNVLAQSNLGWLYQNGHGVPQDYAEALRLYRLAAASGHGSAQNNLGTMFLRGMGVPCDTDSARYWFAQAAAQGLPVARQNLERLK